jgi:hypothetical protein
MVRTSAHTLLLTYGAHEIVENARQLRVADGNIVPRLPTTFNNLSAYVRFEYQGSGPIHVAIRFRDQSGNEILRREGTINVPADRRVEVANFTDLPLRVEHPGDYIAELFVDGVLMTHYTFPVSVDASGPVAN